jgi:hypothetical protein
MKPNSTAPEHQAYGIIVQLILQATAPYQHRIEHTEAHPEKERPTTATLPGRPPIPRAQWTLQNHLNVLADRYSAPALPPFTDQMFVPHKVVVISAFDLLNGFMPAGWTYWQHDGMPTVNPLGVSTLRAERYLARRDAAGSYYPRGYWTASQIGLLSIVLNILAPGRNHGLRATYLGIVHDQFPHGRKTAQYEKLEAPNPCPLCDQPDSLEHIILECENLHETRLEVKHTSIFWYLPPNSYVRKTRQPMPELHV